MKRFTAFLSFILRAPLMLMLSVGAGAQLAKNTKHYIATGTGAAITVTAISKAFRAEVTGTHALASVAGMTEMNGLTGTVMAVTGTTAFVVDIDSRAFTTYTSAGTATPVTWTQIKGIKGVNPSGASIATNDISDLESDSAEFNFGLPDAGTWTEDIHILESDPGQIAALASYDAGLVKDHKIVTTTKTRTFSAGVTKWPNIPTATVGGVQTGSAEYKISGVVVVS